jgi:glycosyltransferase involved in cell wall biosynthesis
LQGAPNPPSEFVVSLTQKQELTVSLVICTRFRLAALQACLRAVTALKRRPDELIIVDNSTGDKGVEDLAREFSAVYVIEPAVGLSRARNRGLSASQAQIVSYLDDDALPEEHWLEQIIEPFANPRVAVVTGSVIVPDTEQYTATLSQPFFLDNTDERWFEIAAFGGLGIGTNMALRKSACGMPDFFDERLGRGAPFHEMEEHLAFAKLLSQGYCGAHRPAAIVYHSSQNPMNLKREARFHFAYSMLLFSEFPKHRKALLRFLFDRMRRKPLTWVRDSPDPGEIVSSNWRVLLYASLSGSLLYLKTRRPKK